ncbi:MAG: enolase C-terminal domain-like protein [Acidobacteriota bacterium]
MTADEGAVGESFRICIHRQGEATPVMAMEFWERAMPYRSYFVEEARQIEDWEELAQLRRQRRIPLARGERLITKYGFAGNGERRLEDYARPGVIDCGGLRR